MDTLKLSEKQDRIVQLVNGSYLVLASAGSGKTRVLTERIRLLSKHQRGKILAITFTNKAAAEIAERLESSDTILKNVFVGTFHSFCQSILEVRFKFLGYPRMPHIFEEDSDRIELIKEVIGENPYFQNIYTKLDNNKRSSYLYEVLNFISTVKRELISPNQLNDESENDEFRLLFDSYQDILKSQNAIDFDDILLLVYELLTNVPSVANLYRKSYKYICVDESQDLNKLQYFLLKALCGDTIKNLMMVGDPNQSIYGFNGSASSYMQKDFVEDFNAEVITLPENYRSSSSVIEAANVVMDINIEPSPYVIKGLFNIQGFNNEESEAKYVVKTITDLVAMQFHNDIEGAISFDRFSILARNHFVFKQVEVELQNNLIPYFYKSGNRGVRFSSQFLKIFDLSLRVKINPFDRLHQNQLNEILQFDKARTSPEVRQVQKIIADEIRNIVGLLTIDNFHLCLKTLRLIFEESLLNDDEKKLAIDESNDLKNHLIRYKQQNMNPTLEGFKSALALGLTNLTYDNSNGVCLSTIHTMKGQESEIVFLIGLDDGTFPDFRAVARGGNELQQELNNLYVAFTRAKRFLFVSYPRTRIMPWGDVKSRSMSRFLKPFVD